VVKLDLVNPMLETTLSIEKSSQLVGAWNMVTIILLVTSYILLLDGFNKKYSTNIELIKIIGYLNLLFCFPFIIAGLYYGLISTSMDFLFSNWSTYNDWNKQSKKVCLN